MCIPVMGHLAICQGSHIGRTGAIAEIAGDGLVLIKHHHSTRVVELVPAHSRWVRPAADAD